MLGGPKYCVHTLVQLRSFSGGGGSPYDILKCTEPNRNLQTPLRSCCKRFSAKTGKLPFCIRVASLPLGAPVELGVIFEVGDLTMF